MAELEQAAGDYAQVMTSSAEASPRDNYLLYTSERELIREEGLPGRPWFTHQIYAPGFYTGYGVKTIPGVREAIEERQFQLVEEEIGIVTEVLNGMAERVNTLANP